MSGLQPMVRTQINGQDAWLIADSGAFFSTLTQAAVEQFHLPYNSFQESSPAAGSAARPSDFWGRTSFVLQMSSTTWRTA